MEAPGSFWLTNARLLDPAGGHIESAALQIVEGRIQQIGEPPATPGPHDLDARGWVVLPGLITCHAHLQAIYPYSRRDENEPPGVTAIRAAATAREAPLLGITTIRSLHEQHAVDLVVRRAINSGWSTGPRILGAGRAISVTGGHGDGLGCRVADGPDGIYAAATTELEGGADHVKIYISGGLARAGEAISAPQMSLLEMAAAVRAADEHGTYVVAHASSSEAIALGLQAGIRAFEHAYELDAETAAALRTQGAFLTPTLVVTHSPDWRADQGFDEASTRRINEAAEGHLESIRRAIAAGVRLVNGTDSPPNAMSRGIPQVIREVELMVGAGLSPLDAIRGATSEAAALLRLPNVGRIAVDAAADLVAVEGNPMEDITALRRLRLVIQAGHVIGGRA